MCVPGMELRSADLATSSSICWAILLTKPRVFAHCFVLSNSVNLSLSYKNILESNVNRSMTDVRPPLLEVQIIRCGTSTNKAQMNVSSRAPFCNSVLVSLASAHRDNITAQSALFSACIYKTNSEDNCSESRSPHYSTRSSLFPSPLPWRCNLMHLYHLLFSLQWWKFLTKATYGGWLFLAHGLRADSIIAGNSRGRQKVTW